MFDFEKFHVYNKAKETYAKLGFLFQDKTIDSNIKSQLKRASSSIILNIAEGAGKYSKLDKKNFYTIARGSTNECIAILDILKIDQNITEKQYNELYNNFLEVNKMLSGLINKMVGK